MDIYELIGIIIGDGHIIFDPKESQYRLEIFGNASEDNEYFNDIADFIEKLIKIRPHIRRRSGKEANCLVLYINNKGLIEHLINGFRLPYGNKTYNVKIPKNLVNWKFSRNIIRGIFESDGSLYFSRIKNHKYPKYPRVTIRSVSKSLIKQLKWILEKKGFSVHKHKDKNGLAIKLYISGYFMFNKWLKEIGFSNPKTISKILLRNKLR